MPASQTMPSSMNSCHRFSVIVAYVCVWTCFYLLVHHSGEDNDSSKSNGVSSSSSSKVRCLRSAIFVITVEMIKIIVSCILYVRKAGTGSALKNQPQSLPSFLVSKDMVKLMRAYFPPAMLYAIYNNLMFLNLSSVDPTAYLVLSSSRLLMTTAVWRMQFNGSIAPIRKFAILLITCGILAKNAVGQNDSHSETLQEKSSLLGYGGILLIVFQMMSSVVAGVWNEKLLKVDGGYDQNLQNIALYLNSFGINLAIVLLFRIWLGGTIFGSGGITASNLYVLKDLVLSPSSILIVSSLAAAGIISSLVLRYETSVTKSVASASETVLTAIVEHLFFGHVYNNLEVLGVMLVSIGTAMYSIPSFPRVSSRSAIGQYFMRRGLQCALVGAAFIRQYVARRVLCLFIVGAAVMGASELVMSVNSAVSIGDDAMIFPAPVSQRETNLRQADTNILKNDVGNDIGNIIPEYTSGFISCLESQDDVIFALELAQSFDELEAELKSELSLELYHYSRMSPYLTAMLEMVNGVRVVDITRFKSEASGCVKDSLSLTHLTTVTMLEPTMIFLPRQFPEASRNEISTSTKIYDAVKSAGSQEDFNFGRVPFHAQDEELFSIFSSNQKFIGRYFHKVHKVGGVRLPFDYISLDRGVVPWASYYQADDFICQEANTPPRNACPTEVAKYIKASIKRYRQWQVKLLLDREELGWIAFDGGLTESSSPNACASFNSLEGAMRSADAIPSNQERRTILNIDLITSSTGEDLLAMHDKSQVGPYTTDPNFDRNIATQNPCLSSAFISQRLDDNAYRRYGSSSESFQNVSYVGQFLDLTSKGTGIVFDLKDPDLDMQKRQVELILSNMASSTRSSLVDVGIRYYPSEHFLPSQPLLNDMTTKINLKLYANAPSRAQCLDLEAYVLKQHEIDLAGCFVSEANKRTQERWAKVSRDLGISRALEPTGKMKTICDIPAGQPLPDSMYWRQGLVKCVEDGYNWIHHPFPVSAHADHSAPKHSTELSLISIDESLIKTELHRYSQEQTSDKSEQFKQYISHWAIASPFLPLSYQYSFEGDKILSPTNKSTHVFRCITKILTVMLFLRLEEFGLVSVDDFVVGSSDRVTWKQVFSNTAGSDGKLAGDSFEYSNGMWSCVSRLVEKVTGVSFIDAISHYVLTPMGLEGSFDPDTEYPPIEARGYRGTADDLLAIGGTLASGGVSPVTRLRVISTSSVQNMLNDWTSIQNVTSSFMSDKTVKSMDRFSYGKTSNGNNVNGYGMGLWHAKGWRTRDSHNSEDVHGWLSLGSSEALLYFDDGGLVVAMCATERILGLEMTATFKSIVNELGNRLNMAYKSNSQALNQLDEK